MPSFALGTDCGLIQANTFIASFTGFFQYNVGKCVVSFRLHPPRPSTERRPNYRAASIEMWGESRDRVPTDYPLRLMPRATAAESASIGQSVQVSADYNPWDGATGSGNQCA